MAEDKSWEKTVKPSGLIDYDNHYSNAHTEIWGLVSETRKILDARSNERDKGEARQRYINEDMLFQAATEGYMQRLLQGWALDSKRFDLEAYKKNTAIIKKSLAQRMQAMGAGDKEITDFLQKVSDIALDEITPHL